MAAVHDLARLEAAGEVVQLTQLLAEPPIVTWAVQIAVLNAVAELGLPFPNIRHLQDVDNLHVQVALAPTQPC